MVKPLKDILAEIEETESIRRFQAGGPSPDEDPGTEEGSEVASDPSPTEGGGATEEGDEGVDYSDQGETVDINWDEFVGLPPDSVVHDPIVLKPKPKARPRSQIDKENIEKLLEKYREDRYKAGIPGGIQSGQYGKLGVGLQPPDLLEKAEKPLDWVSGLINLGIGLGAKSFPATALLSPFINVGDKGTSLGIGPPGAGVYDMVMGSNYGQSWGKIGGPKESKLTTEKKDVVEALLGFPKAIERPHPAHEKVWQPPAANPPPVVARVDINPPKLVAQNGSTPPQPKKNGYTPPPSLEDLDNTPVVTPTQKIARKIAEVAVEPETKKSWSFDPGTWYPSAQGGPIESYQMGGLAGMMNRRMMDNQLMAQQTLRFDPYSGNRPARPPQHGGFGLHDLPRPPQFPGFLGPFGPQRPPRPPPQQPRLEPKTYFHEHEGGKVTYPNFPKPFINPPDRPNNWKGGRGQQIAAEPDPTRITQLEDKLRGISPVDETGMPRPYSPLEPVPPISISETTATAMEPEAVEEATQQTTIEEARPVPREIDIQMPENITATLDFPEEVTGTANYRRGGIASLLRGLAPLAAGWALGPMGHIPAMMAGAGTQYALAGKKRSFLDAIKGGLAGYSGSAVGRLGTAAAGKSPADLAAMDDKVSVLSKDISALGATPKGMTGWESVKDMASKGTTDYWDKIGNQFSGLGSAVGAMDLDAYGNIAKELAGPAAAMIGQTAITTPAERPEVAEIEVAQYQAMTPEQRRAYIESKRSQYGGSPMMQPTVFAPPNVDIGWQPNYAAKGGSISPNPQAVMGGGGLTGMGLLGSLLQKVIAERQAQGKDSPGWNFKGRGPYAANEDIETIEQSNTFAADGGVMEIGEEMESGSFVLPADVVSNVGDGSSDSGHRRLTQLFGGGDEYALGGGTGILKGPVKGVGSGLDDLIQTGIDGVKVARLSSDEFVVPKDVVRRLGEGSQKAGSEKLYDFMKDVRLKKHGTAEQPKEMHMSGLRKMV